MANTAQARKRARQADQRRQHNIAQRSSTRTYIKQVLKAVETKDKAAAQEAYKRASSTIDRLVNKGNLHRNAAARYKSRLNTRVRALG